MKKILKVIAMLLVIAAVVFAAGCAEKTETAGNETQEDSEQVSPEIPATGQIVTAADNGTSISLKNGENFTLQLTEDPSTDYFWELNLSEGLSILRDYYSRDEAPGDQVGVPENHSWIIQAVAPGSQQVNGIYKRSWENATGTEDNFTLAVEVE